MRRGKNKSFCRGYIRNPTYEPKNLADQPNY